MTQTPPTDELKLRTLLSEMDVPAMRALVRDDSDVHWLGRNVALNNPDHPFLPEVRRLLKARGARMVM